MRHMILFKNTIFNIFTTLFKYFKGNQAYYQKKNLKIYRNFVRAPSMFSILIVSRQNHYSELEKPWLLRVNSRNSYTVYTQYAHFSVCCPLFKLFIGILTRFSWFVLSLWKIQKSNQVTQWKANKKLGKSFY